MHKRAADLMLIFSLVFSFLVCLDHFEILRSIGRGSFGKVL